MKIGQTLFLSPPEGFCDLDKAKVVVVPFPYEGGVSWGKGAALGPQAVLESSQQLEFYDEVLECEPFQVGIATLAAPVVPKEPGAMLHLLHDIVAELLGEEKFVVVIGGDHSITGGFFNALAERRQALGVVQFDAHADLRSAYMGDPLSHACVMARIREKTPHTVQVGIRSLSRDEADLIRKSNLQVGFMHHLRAGRFDFEAALATLPETVFLTIDVDVFDWSVIRSTGTPEPGGMLWNEAMDLLTLLFERKHVVGFDVVELSSGGDDPNSAFAVAKLIYRLIGMKFRGMLG